MNSFVSFFGDLLGYINNLAVRISVFFTNADSGAILVAVIFYLVAIISIILLTKLLFKVVHDLFPSKKRLHTSPQELSLTDPESMSTSAPLNNVVSDLENFDGQAYLDRLSSEYNKLNEENVSLGEFKHIDNILPALSPETDSSNQIELSQDAVADLHKKVEGKDLSTLREMLIQAEGLCSEISFKLSQANDQLAICSEAHVNFLKDESKTSDEFNATIVEYEQLKEEWESAKTLLAEEYSKVHTLLTDFISYKAILLDQLKQAQLNLESLPEKVEEFVLVSQASFSETTEKLQKQSDTLKALKDSYLFIHDSRIQNAAKLTSLQEELHSLNKERLICDKSLFVIKDQINELEKLERERFEAEQAARRAEEEKARQEHEEMLRIAKESARQATQDSSSISNEDSDTPEQASARAKIQKAAQNAYALNFDDMSPEAYKKLIASMGRNQENIKKMVQNDLSGSSSEGAQNPHPEEESMQELLTSSEENVSGEGREEAPAAQPDYFAELQKEWAAERAHKQAWAEEQAKKEADIQRRKIELKQELDGNNTSAADGK